MNLFAKICLKAQFLIRAINDKLLANKFQKKKKGAKMVDEALISIVDDDGSIRKATKRLIEVTILGSALI